MLSPEEIADIRRSAFRQEMICLLDEIDRLRDEIDRLRDGLDTILSICNEIPTLDLAARLLGRRTTTELLAEQSGPAQRPPLPEPVRAVIDAIQRIAERYPNPADVIARPPPARRTVVRRMAEQGTQP